MHLEGVLERGCRRNWRPCSSDFGDALGGRDRARLEKLLEAMIKRVWRCTWRTCWCELGGQNRVSIAIHLEAVIEPVWRCTCRPWSSRIGAVIGGGQSGCGSSGGIRDSNTYSIQ